jgi:hypothetical protein
MNAAAGAERDGYHAYETSPRSTPQGIGPFIVHPLKTSELPAVNA